MSEHPNRVEKVAQRYGIVTPKLLAEMFNISRSRAAQLIRESQLQGEICRISQGIYTLAVDNPWREHIPHWGGILTAAERAVEQ